MTEENRIHIEGLSPAHVQMLKAVAAEAAEQAVSKTLVAMGLDPSRPFDAQADMQFLRSTRLRCEGATGKILLSILGLAAVGGATAFWVGFKTLIK